MSIYRRFVTAFSGLNKIDYLRESTAKLAEFHSASYHSKPRFIDTISSQELHEQAIRSMNSILILK